MKLKDRKEHGLLGKMVLKAARKGERWLSEEAIPRVMCRSQIMGLMLPAPIPLLPPGLPWRSLMIPSEDIVVIFVTGLVAALLSYLPVNLTKTMHH